MKKSSLTVVGTGIKFLSQMTLESKTYIEKADKVLYLVNDPVLKQWIADTNSNSESLDGVYFNHEQRLDSYSAITKYILNYLSKPVNLCVVMYGHPAVFSKPALDAVKVANEQGYPAKILPGISAEDCLFADLLIDPGTCGCQSYEATDFLLYSRKFDPNSHLILWQPDVIGMQTHIRNKDIIGISLLRDRLLKSYQPDHPVVIYEAAQYPGLLASIKRIELMSLPDACLSSISTLYIQPAGSSDYDRCLARMLAIEEGK